MFEKIKNAIPLNFELLGNPYNWVIIPLVVVLVSVGLAALLTSYNRNFAQENDNV